MFSARRSDAIFALATTFVVLAAHAVAFFTHEFAHSFTAWALGYMANPFALDYGGLNPGNLIFLLDVGDNVQYAPILNGGHGLAVAAIALAGPFVGNALLYVILYAVARRSRPREKIAPHIVFWLLAMCAGNVWSYVPIRAITTHADIAIAASGLGIGVWTLLPILLVPSLLVVGHFFAKCCPAFIPAIAGGSTARTALMVALVSMWIFVLFGGVGFFGSYGAVSQAFSMVSEMLLAPLAVVWLWPRVVTAAN